MQLMRLADAPALNSLKEIVRQLTNEPLSWSSILRATNRSPCSCLSPGAPAPSQLHSCKVSPYERGVLAACPAEEQLTFLLKAACAAVSVLNCHLGPQFIEWDGARGNPYAESPQCRKRSTHMFTHACSGNRRSLQT